MKTIFRATLSAFVPLLLATALPALAQDATAPETASPVDAAASTVAAKMGNDSEQGVLFPFSLFDLALEKRVDNAGNVDYANLKGDENLSKFIAAVASADLSRFPTYEIDNGDAADKTDGPANAGNKRDKNAKDKIGAPKVDRTWELTFWINAYNALVLKTIADAYPINSVDEIKEFDAPGKFTVAGKKMSLAEMREKVASLDRRALFLLTDGTHGGPKPAPRAYRWTGLNEAMEIGVSAFVNDPRFVELTRIQNRVAVNPFLASVDEYWKPPTARNKWDGVRFVLKAYTDTKANKSYFNTGNYQVLFLLPDHKVNSFSSVIDG